MISNVSVVKKETFISGLGRMIGAEFLKLRKRQMTWVLLSILVGIIVLVNLLLLAISKVKTPGTGLGAGNIAALLGLQSAVPFAFSMMASFGTVLAIILTASSMGGEYNWKTIRPALVSSESRFKFIIAKLVSLGILILIGMLIAVIAGFIMGLITTGLGGNAYSFGFLTGSYIWTQFLQYWRTFYIIMPFALLGFMMAIVGRSAMPGIATGIGVVFLEAIITTFMTAAGGWIAKVPAYLLNANMTAITALNKLPGRFGGGGGGTDTTIPSLTHAFVILGLYSVIFLVFSFYLFRNRDVTG
ncbi:MAG TPA: ABC transporter permease subunit [Dehalococcoidales bacterium]|nr:ABC transporter permease subunit [Dehalococcoidales bacterium]